MAVVAAAVLVEAVGWVVVVIVVEVVVVVLLSFSFLLFVIVCVFEVSRHACLFKLVEVIL